MFSSILFAGLLAASAFASPDVETPTALERRADRKYCGAVVANAEPPNQYCYQFCDLEVNKIIGAKREHFLTTTFILLEIKSSKLTPSAP